MLVFAHIFIGKEFTDLVSGIGCATLKYGGSAAIAGINYMVADCSNNQVNLSRLKIHDNAPAAELIGSSRYTVYSWEELQTISLTEFRTAWHGVYNTLINACDGATQLYVMLHFPLYKESSLCVFEKLYKGINSVNLPTQLDFVGYTADFAKIIEPNISVIDDVKSNIVRYAEFRKREKMPCMQHLIVLQNANRLGITLGLNQDSLVEVISQFSLACSSNYNELLPNVLNYKDVVAFGLASLEVDKFLVVDYLLHRTILNAMDNASINQNEVSASYATERTEHLLKHKPHLLSQFFKREEELPFSQVQEQFQKEAEEIIKQCDKIIQEESSIPTRTAILAAMLSKTDCELFSQSIYNRDGVCFYDLFSEGLDFFIENDYGGYHTIDGKAPVNPIPELKELDAKVIDLEAQKRNFMDQLRQIEQQIKLSGEVRHCYIENGVFHFNNQDFRLMPDLKQDLLEETFQPREGIIVPESVDLRKGFRSIQNQGTQGSCLAHALTAIFEYAIKLSNNTELDLSESFLYYNARKMDDTGDVSVSTDTGSRIKPAVESLRKYGLAQEEYCRYNDNDYTTEPSPEAYDDGARRRLVKALNVGISTSAIKVALAEGYPVAVSLALYSSFTRASKDGYVPMPEEKEIEDRINGIEDEKVCHSSHAMVIVGYSDKLRRFILRNSWGIDWGDDGYCYVPYDYIDDERLCTSATILTEIESLPLVNMKEIPTLSINDQDLHIRYYIIQAMCKKVEEDLKMFQQRRAELFVICEELTTRFSALPNKRDEYLSLADVALTQKIEQMRARRRNVDEELETLQKQQRQFNIKGLIRIGCFILAVFAFDYAWDYLWKTIGIHLFNIKWWMPCIISVMYTLWTVYILHKHWESYRETKHTLEYEKENLAKEIQKTEEIKDTLKYKTFAAYHLLQTMNDVRNRLEDKYLNYVKLINNLRAWYAEIKLSQTSMTLERSIPVYSLLDKTLLDDFFDQQLKSDKSGKIDFYALINSEIFSDEDFRKLRQDIVDAVTINIFRHQQVKNFSVTEHIVSNPTSWIKSVDRNMLREFERRADLFIQFSVNASPDIVCSSYLLGNKVSDYQHKFREYLMHLSGVFATQDISKITYVTIATLEFKDCEALRTE